MNAQIPVQYSLGPTPVPYDVVMNRTHNKKILVLTLSDFFSSSQLLLRFVAAKQVLVGKSVLPSLNPRLMINLI